MSRTALGGRPAVLILTGCLLAWLGTAAAGEPPSPDEPRQPLSVSAEVALSSLIALSDGHLQKMADSLHLLASGDAARAQDWERLEAQLAEVAERNVDALNWFALPDGSYWSVQHGPEAGNLAIRGYFPRVLAGETIVGDLVVSRATGEPVAIVAVPVFGTEGTIVGVLGASVYLDRLSERLDREMGLGDTEIFFSFDESPLVALVWDPQLVFLEPMQAGEPDLARAFAEMLEREAGTVRYTFRDTARTVVYRRSEVTGWWYAFGIVPGGREAGEPPP
jgi:hypothetical protein